MIEHLIKGSVKLSCTKWSMINQKVQVGVWHYVPNGDDVDKDFLGDIIGTVESVALYNPNILKIKVEKFKPNVGNAEWTDNLSELNGASHYENGYLEEWYYNAKSV
jgi:hypothetical protein